MFTREDSLISFNFDQDPPQVYDDFKSDGPERSMLDYQAFITLEPTPMTVSGYSLMVCELWMNGETTQ